MTNEPRDDEPTSPETPGAEDDQETTESGKARKERVLHTRVPAVLEQELKRLAETLRIPVSNVVRTILEDALDAVDVAGRRAEGEIRSVAERLAEERRRLREPLLGKTRGVDEPATKPAGDPHAIDGAVGFTPMVLANDAVCAVTGETLPRGSQAFFVLFTEPGRHAIVGPTIPSKPR